MRHIQTASTLGYAVRSMVIAAQDVAGLIDLPIPSLKCFLGEKEVLAILHVRDGITGERVLFISRRQINAQPMIATENVRWNFDEGREIPAIVAEEIWINDARIVRTHHQQTVRPSGPMELIALDEAGLEIDERLPGLDLERCDIAVLASLDRLNIVLPV